MTQRMPQGVYEVVWLARVYGLGVWTTYRSLFIAAWHSLLAPRAGSFEFSLLDSEAPNASARIVVHLALPHAFTLRRPASRTCSTLYNRDTKSHDRDKATHCTTSKPATADTPETVLFFSLDSTIVPFEIRHHYHHGRHRASK
jgi:hypothetical protein